MALDTSSLNRGNVNPGRVSNPFANAGSPVVPDISGMFRDRKQANIFSTVSAALQMRREVEKQEREYKREERKDALEQLKFEQTIKEFMTKQKESEKDRELSLIKEGIDPSGDIKSQVTEKTALEKRKLLGESAKLEAEVASIGKPDDKTQFDMIDKLSDDIRSIPAVKDFSEVRRASSNIVSAYKKAVDPKTSSRLAADQALITSFNKILDPGSVVRESEYGRTEQGQALLSSVEGRYRALTAGGTGLTDAARREILEMALLVKENARKFAEQESAVFLDRADRFKVDRALVASDLFSPEEDIPEQIEVEESNQKRNILKDIQDKGAIEIPGFAGYKLRRKK